MKITSYSLTAQANHIKREQHNTRESLRVTVEQPTTPALSTVGTQITLSTAANQQSSQNSVAETKLAAATDDPKIQLLLLLLEKMTGRKLDIFNVSDMKASRSSTPPAINQAERQPASGRVGFSVDYRKEVNYSEIEQTVFQTNGLIKTADGQEIAFDLTLSMHREFYQSDVTSLHFGDPSTQVDPLLINFNGTAAQLSDQRFSFDLNSDGIAEQINAPSTGSGFLVFDKNGDGQVNNGSELFGPNTSNGFSELAQYDENGDHWLDESDTLFQHLKIWTDTTENGGKLTSLASAGVGAIYLAATDTPFEIKNSSNQLLGTVRSSSVVVNEDGSVNTIQQIDLTA